MATALPPPLGDSPLRRLHHLVGLLLLLACCGAAQVAAAQRTYARGSGATIRGGPSIRTIVRSRPPGDQGHDGTTVCQCLQFHQRTTCPSGFVRCNGKCLKFHSMKANWLEAKQLCEATRSKLISIESRYEQSCVMGYIHRHKDTFPGSFWTGGNNLADQFEWRWVANNAPIGRYRRWQEGNPDDGGRGSEHCMELEKNYFYRWNDQPCDMRNHFICQIELNRIYSTPP